MAMARPTETVWKLLCQRLNEHDVEYCRTLQQRYYGHYFQIRVRVKRQPCYLIHPDMPSTLTTLDLPSSESETVSFFCESWEELEENVLSRLETNLSSHHIIPEQFIPPLARNVIHQANELVQICPPGFGYCNESPHFTWFNFVLNITVRELYNHDQITHMMLESITRGVRNRMPELHDNGDHSIMAPEVYHNEDHTIMVPGMWEPLTADFQNQMVVQHQMEPTSIATESLKKVKLEKGAAMESCSICLTELGDGPMEVSSTPCKHLFHKDCLVQWLIKSPTCPLCRYNVSTIPTLIDYT